MKKSLLSLLLLLLSMVASAHDFCVGGIYYNIINGNEVAVTYQGTNPNGNYGRYTGQVNIPTFVTYNNTTYTVTAIGDNAFKDCFGMTGIEIPNFVTIIGDDAFFGCNGLTGIVIPNSVTSIGKQAFYGCYGLNYIDIGISLTSIGRQAFLYCNRLARINVESGNAIYDSRGNCNAIIETASNKLICGCKNTIIPNSVTSIGDFAFLSCYELTDIVIPNSVTSIGEQAFVSCSGLTGIVIPNSVTSIGKQAFYYCEELTRISVESGNAIYDSRGNCNAIIETASNKLICGCKNTIIPSTVTSIDDGAFISRFGLTSIVIPNSVTSIGTQTFCYCFYLTSIEFGNSVSIIGEQALSDCGSLTDIYCYSQVPPTCFDNTFNSYTATLHVSAASLAAYFTAPYWCNFENIIGDAVAPTGISISNDSINLQPSEQLTLMATVTPQNASNKEITWISTDTTVATVNNGVVYAIGCGECDIIASCFGMQAVCHVSVANRIILDQQEAMLLPNHILTLTPVPTVSGIYAVSSTDPTVAAARVLSSGMIQVVGIKEGTTTITVSSVDGAAIPATCLVTVYTETGDMDCDGFVAISDVTSLIDYLLNGDSSLISTKNADVDGDGNISINDVTVLIDALLHNNEQSSLRKIKDWGE